MLIWHKLTCRRNYDDIGGGDMQKEYPEYTKARDPREHVVVPEQRG